MEVFQLILCIIGVVVFSSFVSRFIPKVSTPLVQIAMGAIITQVPGFPNASLNPELFMVLFIAPLLYLEAREIDKSELLKSLKLSLSLAIGLAIATMVAVGVVVHAVWPSVTLAAALALGAALGPTDAVAVSSLGKEASLSLRQLGVLKGESLFNDASGIVGFQFAIAAAITGEFAIGRAAGEFALSFIGGAVYGLTIGLLANWLFETVRSLGWETTTTRILMELFLPFMLYLTAEELHVSGILAVVASGLFVRFDRTGIGPNVARTNIVSSSVWGVLSFSLNGAVFILLGMQLPKAMSASWDDPGVSNVRLSIVILLVSLVVVTMRFLWVAGMLRLARDVNTGKRRKMTPARWRSAAVMTFGGAKGTITLSLMFTIPFTVTWGVPFPMRDELIFIASGVIVVTLLLANFMLPLLAPNRDRMAPEMTEITIEILRKTVEELTGRVDDENRRAVLMVIESYTKRITRLKQRVGESDPQGLERLQIEALHWEKDYLKSLLAELKMHPLDDAAEQDMRVEACERMMDDIMNTLRHTSTDSSSGHAVSQIRGRMRAFERRAENLGRRISSKIRRTTPLISEDEMFAHSRLLQLDVMEHVVDRLYEEDGTRHLPYGALLGADPRLSPGRGRVEVTAEHGRQREGDRSGGRDQARELRHRAGHHPGHARGGRHHTRPGEGPAPQRVRHECGRRQQHLNGVGAADGFTRVTARRARCRAIQAIAGYPKTRPGSPHGPARGSFSSSATCALPATRPRRTARIWE